MKHVLLFFTLAFVSVHAQSAVILQSGESYASEFTLISTPNTFKFTDNFWDIGVDLIDSGAPPFDPTGNAGTLTLSLFENSDLTGLITSISNSTSFPGPDGVLFFGNEGGLIDLNGSLLLQYEGDGEATLNSIFVGRFGANTQSGVFSTVIIPEGAPSNPMPPTNNVSAPAISMLMLSLIALLLFRKR